MTAESDEITAGGVPIDEVHEQQRQATQEEPAIVDDAIERTEGASVYDLARRMQFAVRDFAEAYARLMSDRNVPQTCMSISIDGRSDSDINVTFAASQYQSGTGYVVDTPKYGDPVHVIDDFLERWDRVAARARPMITHKR